MWTALCLAALVATAVGSPFGTALNGKSNGLDAHSYSLEVRKGLSTLGPAALVFDEYAICSASILRGANASALSVRIGSRIFFNLFGESVKVSEVLLHPDGADVAVLKLQKPVTYKSASSIAVVGPEGVAPGTRVQVSSWNFASFLKVADEWLVLPKYCAGPGLCATGAAGTGALVSADGQLVGLAGSSKGNGTLGGVESVVDLAERSVQKFIAVATNRVPPTPPTPPTPPPSPATETPATEAPPTEPTAPTVPTPTKRPSGKTCAISTQRGFPSQEPILLREQDVNTAALTFRDPDQADSIELASGERVVVVCSGSGNYLNLDKKLQEAVVACVEDTTFLFKGQKVEWSSLGCKTIAANSARRAGKCGNSGEFSRIEIGFQATSGFAVQIENCFNSVTFDAVYSRMNMTPAIAGHESGGKRPQFTPAGFYEGFDPNNLYKNKAQKKTVGELLGDASLGNKYIKDGSSSYFLARGHLSAKADYILDAQQRATFYYINVAPQWQTFNAKNWENLEDSVRRWVVSSGRSVQVVTGTWGVATLPNIDGVETELYLGGSKKTLRVPKYYWKVVYDPATKEGAVFVGLNNPYHVTTDEDVFCKDECARYTWLSWVQKDQDKGYSFCCDVNEFRKTVTTLPNDIDVKALL